MISKKFQSEGEFSIPGGSSGTANPSHVRSHSASDSERVPNEFRAASRWDFLGNTWMSAKPRTTKNRVLSRLGLMITNINLNNMENKEMFYRANVRFF